MSDEEPPKPDYSSLVRIMKRQAQILQSVSGVDNRAEDEAQAIAEDKYEDIQRQKAETAGLKEKNRDLRHNRKLRSAYAKSVFCYLIWYSVFVAVVLVLSGFNICGFSLHEDVLKFLVGSTAAAAIGLVYAVTNGLFDGVGKK
ncbi:hypothetical protein VK792_18250 [Mesobacterium sp. TK19101]|uniref:Uncharacterized protein n=1 Tax=Mesobacterium hydrothermale TaxID=3111907 RepID=A0ABU6HLB1_9RHOB|nr:hypothetical protein [Mesobacterium sp. TK19101]MEC3863239.1 hypothetical protein [Mesobacterium sp. TK19101]